MKTYREFIDRMIEKGYVLTNDEPTIIDASNSTIKEFYLKKGTIGKILEIRCPDENIIALCGTEHIGGCNNHYICDIRCIDNDNLQPFQDMHRTIPMNNNQHVVAEIVITKILQQDPPLYNKKVKDWSEKINSILKLIGSENHREHVMWVGAYPKFNSEFIKGSFTLYGGQKMIFYAVNPDVDIIKTNLKMKADIFQKVETVN